jgi:hypothetical protein
VLQGLEPQHRVHPPLHPSVVLLDDMMEVKRMTERASSDRESRRSPSTPARPGAKLHRHPA